MATVGTFDGVHLGHRALLRQLVASAAELKLVPTVVTFREHPRRAITPDQAPPMLMSAQQRAEAIVQTGVDDVIMLDFNGQMRMRSAREFLEFLHDNYFIKALLMGFNNAFGHDHPHGLDIYRAMGAEIGISIVGAEELTVEGCSHVCSSTIRTLLQTCRPDDAAKLLGAPYRIIGKVVHGKELGRTIGFPTANIAPCDTACLIPSKGVYAASITLADGTVHPAMLNIGHRPSVDSPQAPLSIEAHMLDFSGDIYGSTVAVDFLQYMRPEQQFPSLEALRKRLDADAHEVRRLFENKL
jgi:riboflavin kinase/FMN adenylyltransferase